MPGQVQMGRGLRRLDSQGDVRSAARIVAEARNLMFSREIRPKKADVLADSHPLERYAYDIRDVMSHIFPCSPRSSVRSGKR